MEERKRREAEFHDLIRSKATLDDPIQAEYYTSNKKFLDSCVLGSVALVRPTLSQKLSKNGCSNPAKRSRSTSGHDYRFAQVYDRTIDVQAELSFQNTTLKLLTVYGRSFPKSIGVCQSGARTICGGVE